MGTHGHLPENENYGGVDQGGPDPRLLPDGQTFDRRVGIAGFEYLPGNQGLAAPIGSPPVVRAGEPLRFDNLDWGAQIFHTITACKARATARPASATRSPTARSTSTPVSWASDRPG